MTQRLDALSVRESNGKAYFTKVGVAFPAKKGDGYSVLLDAIPAPVDGQFKLILKTPKDRSEPAKDYPNYSRAQDAHAADDLSDEIPF